MNPFLRGLYSIVEGIADVFSFGAISGERARHHAGLDDPRPDHVKDAESLASDWDAVIEDFATARSNAHHAIRTGTATPDHFRELGDTYEGYVKARTP